MRLDLSLDFVWVSKERPPCRTLEKFRPTWLPRPPFLVQISHCLFLFLLGALLLQQESHNFFSNPLTDLKWKSSFKCIFDNVWITSQSGALQGDGRLRSGVLDCFQTKDCLLDAHCCQLMWSAMWLEIFYFSNETLHLDQYCIFQLKVDNRPVGCWWIYDMKHYQIWAYHINLCK